MEYVTATIACLAIIGWIVFKKLTENYLVKEMTSRQGFQYGQRMNDAFFSSFIDPPWSMYGELVRPPDGPRECVVYKSAGAIVAAMDFGYDPDTEGSQLTVIAARLRPAKLPANTIAFWDSFSLRNGMKKIKRGHHFYIFFEYFSHSPNAGLTIDEKVQCLQGVKKILDGDTLEGVDLIEKIQRQESILSLDIGSKNGKLRIQEYLGDS